MLTEKALDRHDRQNTIHIHEIDTVDYPWQELMNELVKMNYSEWCLRQCASDPEDKITALINQRKLWQGLVANALK